MENKKIRRCLVKYIKESKPNDNPIEFCEKVLRYKLLDNEIATIKDIDFNKKKEIWKEYNKRKDFELANSSEKEKEKLLKSIKNFFNELTNIGKQVEKYNKISELYPTNKLLDPIAIRTMEKPKLLEVINRASLEKITEMIDSNDPVNMRAGVEIGLAYTQPKPLQMNINVDAKDLGLFDKFNKTLKIINIDNEEIVEDEKRPE